MLAATLALALAATLALAGCSGHGPATAPARPPTRTEVAGLLGSLARAVRDHDSTAFAAGLDDSEPAASFRTAQLAAFANLQQLPVRVWRYRLQPPITPASDAPQTRAATRRLDAPALIVHVELDDALAGVDPVPERHDLYLTVVRRDGRTLLAADDALAAVRRPSWRPPWAFGPLVVRSDAHALVLAPAADAAAVPGLATAVAGAVRAVDAVWGDGWTQDVAVVVAASSAQFTALTGLAHPERFSAAAATAGIDPLSGRPYGQRLVVLADADARLSGVGRAVVLRHEITHLASAAATTEDSPRWLVEGLAEYVAERGTSQPVGVAAAELRAQVRAGRVPPALPGDASFEASGAALASAYEQAWLACRLIAGRIGAAGLVALYRQVGAALTPPAQALATALRQRLGLTPAGLTRLWRASLREQLR